MVDVSEIAPYFLCQPEIVAWPAMIDVWHHYAKNAQSWFLPELACRAVGGDASAVSPVITAVACCHISIVLVDDILDDDPKGLYHASRSRSGGEPGAGLSSGFLPHCSGDGRKCAGGNGRTVNSYLAELVYSKP